MKKHDLIMQSGEGNKFAEYLLKIDDKPWYIPAETRRFLIVRDDYTCAVCKKRCPSEFLHIDHIHPVTLGGTCLLSNLQVLCRSCNLQKSGHILDPHSYSRGYVRTIDVVNERIIDRKILEKLEDERA